MIARLVLAATLLVSCQKQTTLKEYTGQVFGSTFSIKYYADKDVSPSIDSIFNEINSHLSTYDSASEISKWNNSKTGGKISPIFKEVFLLSKKYHKYTDGFFDITVAPLVKLWGVGNKNASKEPTQNQIDSVMMFIGMNKLELKRDFLTKKDPRVQLDVNAIVPGFTADKIADWFFNHSIQNFMVDIGGEIRVSGNKVGKPWKIGIEKPPKDIENSERTIQEIVELRDGAIATSGNYRKWKKLPNGKIITHTLDPKIGIPVQSDLLSITIFSSTAAEADALATACMAMGLNETRKFINQKRIKAFLIISEKEQVKTEWLNR